MFPAGSVRPASATLKAGPQSLAPSAEALAQPKWGTCSTIEIPMLPTTARRACCSTRSTSEAGDRHQAVLQDPQSSAGQHCKIIADREGATFEALKQATEDGNVRQAHDGRRATTTPRRSQRIFRRLDDGTIFPAASLEGRQLRPSLDLDDAKRQCARLSSAIVETLFFPGQGVVKSRTQCTEQGSARWLPKPTDVVATFMHAWPIRIVDNGGGGYKGMCACCGGSGWPVADVVGFVLPDGLADIWPGEYSRQHAGDGTITPELQGQPAEAFVQRRHLSSARCRCSTGTSGIRCSGFWSRSAFGHFTRRAARPVHGCVAVLQVVLRSADRTLPAGAATGLGAADPDDLRHPPMTARSSCCSWSRSRSW